jgi:alkanesulfonate monooxygenase SsuD/methylene tetrahydromethanopterin reductase-like flavin-dependent oxidoreductase (luciferase family)
MNLDRQRFRLGLMFRVQYAPELVPDYARRAEAAGFDELWLAEDCFFSGGISAAATALACTQKLTVGLGLMPAVVRNPVFVAMEIATLCRLYPGRFLPAFGHGIGSWMQQIGAFPKSQLNALEEVTTTVKRLLTGEKFDFHGQHVHLEKVQLLLPPTHLPPISLGVTGPKSLALAGRVADGVIIPEFWAPVHIKWARERINTGKNEAGRTDPHQLVVYSLCSVDSDPRRARHRARPVIASMIASGFIHRQLELLGLNSEVERIMAGGGQERLEAEMPDRWIEQFGIVGTPDECVQAIERLVEVGSDSVVLVPLPGQDHHTLDIFSQELLPRLG